MNKERDIFQNFPVNFPFYGKPRTNATIVSIVWIGFSIYMGDLLSTII